MASKKHAPFFSWALGSSLLAVLYRTTCAHWLHEAVSEPHMIVVHVSTYVYTWVLDKWSIHVLIVLAGIAIQHNYVCVCGVEVECKWGGSGV